MNVFGKISLALACMLCAIATTHASAQVQTQAEAPAAEPAWVGALKTTPIYVRGSMNNWSTSDKLAPQRGGMYTNRIALKAGRYEFKIASEDYKAINFGASPEKSTDLADGEFRKISAGGANLTFEAVGDGDYLFMLSNADQGAPYATVVNIGQQTRKSEASALELAWVGALKTTQAYVRGSMNNWSTADKLVHQKGAMFVTLITLKAGRHEFKIASEDNQAISYGRTPEKSVNLEDGDMAVVSAGGANLIFNASVDGPHLFVLNKSQRGEPEVSVVYFGETQK